MIYRPIIAAQASGSLGGTVFSHTRGTQYTRARVTPIDPDTLEQQAMRQAMADVADSWNNDLSPVQRRAWHDYSLAFPRPNRIGDKRPSGGRSEFFRANLLRRQCVNWLGDGYDLRFDPPARGAGPAPDATTVHIEDPGNPTFQVSWSGEREWQASADSRLFVYISNEQQPFINWFRGPYTLEVAHQGTPLESNFSFSTAVPGPLSSPLRLFARLRISYSDGALSQPVLLQIPEFS